MLLYGQSTIANNRLTGFAHSNSTVPSAMSENMGVNGNLASEKADIPATSLLAAFVATTTTSQLTPALKGKVKEVVIDWIGVTIGVTIGALGNADSTGPIYNAILAFQGGEVKGQKLYSVVGKGGARFLPQYAGLLNAALSHSLDFDDTYIDGTLHAGLHGCLSGADAGRATRLGRYL